MDSSNDVHEITRIANSSVDQYFTNVGRRKAAAAAAASNPSLMSEGGRGTSRKKVRIVAADIVEFDPSNTNNNNKDKSAKDEDVKLERDASSSRRPQQANNAMLVNDLDDDDDEWETVVDTVPKVEDESLLKKEEAKSASSPKRETGQQQQQQQTDVKQVDAAQGNDDDDDLGIARAQQKAHLTASRSRVAMSSCSLVVMYVAHGRWLRGIACDGGLAMRLRQDERLRPGFLKLAELLAASKEAELVSKIYADVKRLPSVAKNVDRLRPSWVTVGSASTAAANATSPSNLQQVVDTVVASLNSVWELQLPPPPQQEQNADDDAAAADDDDDATTKPAKRFCSVNELMSCPIPEMLAPFHRMKFPPAAATQVLPPTTTATTAQQSDENKKKKSNGKKNKSSNKEQQQQEQQQAAATQKAPVLHSVWWNVLFAAICNATGVLDVRICVAFDLVVCRDAERAAFGRYNYKDDVTKKEEPTSEGDDRGVGVVTILGEDADDLTIEVKREEDVAPPLRLRDQRRQERQGRKSAAQQQQQQQQQQDKTKNNKKPEQTVWCEVWSVERECYVPVQTISSAFQRQVEIGGPRWNAAYVLAFGKNNSVVDVSVKYATSWAKIFPDRLEYMMRNHHNGELDAKKELRRRFAFSCCRCPRSTTTTTTTVKKDNTKKSASTATNKKETNTKTKKKKKAKKEEEPQDKNDDDGGGDAVMADDALAPAPAPAADAGFKAEDIAAMFANARGLAPLVRNCEYELPPNASWTDRLFARFNSKIPSHHSSAALVYKLARDRLQLHLLKYADPVPKTLLGIKQHPLYIAQSQIARHEAVYPRDASTTAGLFRGVPVYRRAALRPLRGMEGWLRLRRMVKSRDEEPAKICAPPPSRPLTRASRLFGIWQTVPYKPLPLVVTKEMRRCGHRRVRQLPEGGDDVDDDELLLLQGDDETTSQEEEEEEEVTVTSIPTLNDHLDWYVIFNGYKLPEGLTHFRDNSVRGVARRMHIEFASAVVGFEKVKSPEELEEEQQEARNNDQNSNQNQNQKKKVFKNSTRRPSNIVDSSSAAYARRNASSQFFQRKPWRAVFKGVVVKTGDADRLKKAHDEFLAVKVAREKARTRARALQWWNILITRRLAMDRLTQRLSS